MNHTVPYLSHYISDYMGMLNDENRNEFFYQALKRHARDKVVVDVGSGTGILSYYALSFGAKYIYAFERTPHMASLTQKILENNFDQSRFKVISGDFWSEEKQQINHGVDIVVSETIGSGLFDQGMLFTWEHIRPFLNDNAISIPDRIYCDVWCWDEENIRVIESHNNAVLRWLDRNALINDSFSDSLIKFGNAISVSPSDTGCEMMWVNINSLIDKFNDPTIHKDVVSFDMSSNVVTTEIPFLTHPKISFDIDIPQTSFASIIGKFSFEDMTYTIKDTPYMSWKFCPSFILEGGQYSLQYNNDSLRAFLTDEWVCKKR
jgi:Ribosomal protein L11 methyltransferase (PrmA)